MLVTCIARSPCSAGRDEAERADGATGGELESRRFYLKASRCRSRLTLRGCFDPKSSRSARRQRRRRPEELGRRPPSSLPAGYGRLMKRQIHPPTRIGTRVRPVSRTDWVGHGDRAETSSCVAVVRHSCRDMSGPARRRGHSLLCPSTAAAWGNAPQFLWLKR